MAASKDEREKPRGEAQILQFRERSSSKPQPLRQAPSDDDTVEPLSTGALIKIALLVIFLVVGGVWLMNKLRDIGRLEDCAMQGRRNCVTITVPGRNQ